ncbi:beta family protein [Pseudomonas aeruginosa]|uniref:beta family protein n=1 Tax=Pseudomonas aeruginosa TaxID=287 RepID=UPI0028FF7149|nr:hypothetical protein [Pseudomonas aeruginosa]MDU0538045.1 hypothetical protein [Pseudomonas aeruginosa]
MITSDDLDAIKYLPCLRSRRAEMRGYSELQADTKEGLIPLVSLGKLGTTSSAEQVLASVKRTFTKAFIDLNSNSNQICSDYLDYLDPENSYSAWRDLFHADESFVPTAILATNGNVRSFTRQIMEIERRHGVVAIRSKNGAQDLAAMQSAISAVDDVNNVLFILDFGYIRGAVAPRETEARRLISALRAIDPVARIAVVGSSYPRSVSAYGEEAGALEIEELELHAQIGGDAVAIYGDHSSIYPEPFEPSISRFVPRIDYCLADSWIYRRYRDLNGISGYIRCANSILESPDWDPAFAEHSWGAAKIQETAAGVPAGFAAPANWIAARVNMHIERQWLSMQIEDDDDLDAYI